MDRFKINCEWEGKPAEIQFDIKKIPGEKGPCYMVTIDGFFRGYIKKEKDGMFGQLINSNFDEKDMLAINQRVNAII